MSGTSGHKDPALTLLAFLQVEYPAGTAWGDETIKEVHAEPFNPRADASYAVLTEETVADQPRYRIYTGNAEIRSDPSRNLYWSSPESVTYNPHDAAVPAAWLALLPPVPPEHPESLTRNTELGECARDRARDPDRSRYSELQRLLRRDEPTLGLRLWTERASAHARKVTALHTPGSLLHFEKALIGGTFYADLLITDVHDGEIWVSGNGTRLRLPGEARHWKFEVKRLGWPEPGREETTDILRDETRARLEERHLKNICNYALVYSSGRAGLTSGITDQEAVTEFNPLFALAVAWALHCLQDTSTVTPDDRVWERLVIDGVKVAQPLDQTLYGDEPFDVEGDLIRTLTPFGEAALSTVRTALKGGESHAMTTARHVWEIRQFQNTLAPRSPQ